MSKATTAFFYIFIGFVLSFGFSFYLADDLLKKEQHAKRVYADLQRFYGNR